METREMWMEEMKTIYERASLENSTNCEQFNTIETVNGSERPREWEKTHFCNMTKKNLQRIRGGERLRWRRENFLLYI